MPGPPVRFRAAPVCARTVRSGWTSRVPRIVEPAQCSLVRTARVREHREYPGRFVTHGRPDASPAADPLLGSSPRTDATCASSAPSWLFLGCRSLRRFRRRPRRADARTGPPRVPRATRRAPASSANHVEVGGTPSSSAAPAPAPAASRARPLVHATPRLARYRAPPAGMAANGLSSAVGPYTDGTGTSSSRKYTSSCPRWWYQ